MCFTFKTTELFLQPRALPSLPAGVEFRTPQVTSCRDAVQDAGETTWRVRSWQKDHLILKVRSVSICQPPVAGLSRPTTEWDSKCCFNTEFVVPLLWVMHGPAQRKYPQGPPLFHLSEVGRMRTFLLQMPCCPRSWGSGAQTQVRGFQARRSKRPVTALSARRPLSPRGKDHSWHWLEPKVLEHSFFFKPAPKGGSKQKGKFGNTYVQPLTHVLLCSVPRPAPSCLAMATGPGPTSSRNKSESESAPVPWQGPDVGAAASWVSHGPGQAHGPCTSWEVMFSLSGDFKCHERRKEDLEDFPKRLSWV